MKKLLLLLCGCLAAFGAGSVSQSVAPITNSNGFVVTMTWTGDNITGSVPATIILNAQQLQGQRIVAFETAPLSPAPTPGYSITLTDFSGTDLLTGNGANLSATTPALLTLPSAQPPLYGSYTLNVTGNSVASAQGRVVIYFAPVSGIVGVLGPLGTLSAAGTTPSGAPNVTNPVKIAGAFNTTQPTVTNGQIVDVQSTARGAQIVATGVDTFNTTVNTALPTGANTIGAVTQAAGPWTNNLTQVGGTNVVTGGASGLLAVSGPVASAGSNADNPVKIGGVFNSTAPTVTNGQVIDVQTTSRGSQIVATGIDGPLSSLAFDATGAGTLNGVNTTASIAVTGMNSASFVLPAGNTLVGTIAAQYSWDGGVTWLFTEFRNNNTVGGWVSTLAVNSTVGTFSILLPGGSSNVRVTVTAFTSGTASVTLRAVTQPDGSLPGSVGPAVGPSPPFTISNSVFDQTASGTINGNGQSVTLSMNGLSSASVTFNSGNNLVATLQAQYSTDGGTTWTAIPTRIAGFNVWFTNLNSFTQPSHFLIPGGSSTIRMLSTAFTSGSATVTLRAVAQPEMQSAAMGGVNGGNNSPLPPAALMVAGSDYAASAALHAVRADSQGNVATDKGISVFKTYQSMLSGLAIAATPTDVAFLQGNANNTLLITRVEASCTQTTGGSVDFFLARRTTQNTGGTTTAFGTSVPLDTNDAAASSTPLGYTANPATITGDGTFVARKVFVPAPGSGVGTFTYTPEPMGKPVMVRGTAQSININFNGQTVAGLACDFTFTWIETNLI